MLAAVVPALLIAAPWHVAMHAIHGNAFMDFYFGREIASRAAGEIDTDPWWYYFHLFEVSVVWIAAAAWSVVVWRRGRLRSGAADLLSLGLVWSIAWFVLLSMFSAKAPRYLLPVHAGVALAAGPGLVVLSHAVSRSAARSFALWSAPIAAAVALLVALLPVRVQPGPMEDWTGLWAWLEDNNVERAWLGGDDGIGLGHPKTARIYLKTGWWPEIPGDRVFEPGDVRLYHTVRARQWMKPEERIVYQTREIYATVWDPAAAQNSSSPAPLSATSGGDTPR